MPNDAELVAKELAQLTPVQLDAFVFSFHADGLPYSAQMYPSDFRLLASGLLDHESVGDLLATIEHIATA